jgi:hypothetical protein
MLTGPNGALFPADELFSHPHVVSVPPFLREMK